MMKPLSENGLAPGLTPQRLAFWGVALALFAVGCYFRFVGLNSTSMHGDAQFHDFCRAGVSFWDLLTRWPQIMGPNSGQIPPPLAFTKLVLDVLHLPPTLANVILPSSMWGVATIPVALWVGWRLGGRAFGLLLMGVVALNPIHVQMSRMAYYYPPAVLGSFVAVWCLLESWKSVRDRRALPLTFHIAHACATVLLLYSTYGAWPYAFLIALVHIGCAIVNRLKYGTGWRDLVAIGATYLVAGVPLLLVSWGLKAMLGMTGDNAATEYWRRIFALGRGVPIYVQVGYEFLKLAWGWTPYRATFSCLVVISGVVTAVILARRKKEWLLPLGLILVGIMPIVLALNASVWEFGLRRASVIWPPCFILLALGLHGFWLAGERLCRFRVLRWFGIIPVVAAFGVWVHADTLVLKVNGFDVPYRLISDWLDRTFPKGTPVVTDRFFTAMCEFNRSHPTTNVVVISTVPNELPEIQEKNHFRDVTRRYLEENPDAVFYCGNHWYGDPRVKPWEWPTQYFRHRKEFADTCQWRLGSMGQSYWFQHLHLANLRPVVLFYNTLDDVIEIRKQRGDIAFVTFGPDWRPVQTQDYQLWRLMMADRASVTLYNVSSNTCECTATVTGVSAGGRSGLRVASTSVEFAPNQVVHQSVPVTLKLGANVLELRRSGSERGRLLIGRIEVTKSHD